MSENNDLVFRQGRPEHDVQRLRRVRRGKKRCVPTATSLLTETHNALRQDATDCSWLAGRLGDVYPHETLIRHIRGGLDERFPCGHPGETPAQFARRMAKVQAFLNSDAFAAPSGGGLANLARSLRLRCQRLVGEAGGRLRT